MLKRLFVKNFTIIDEIEVLFFDKFNVITGETGAGKSILINAINLILGAKAETALIKKGKEFALIEADFVINSHEILDLLKDEEVIIDGNEITITRQINRTSKNRIFLNEQPISIGFLKKLGDLLIDIHGQHEHQSLLNERMHIVFFDNLGDYKELLDEFNQNYLAYIKLREEYLNLKLDGEYKEKRIRELKEQLKELNEFNPVIDEDKEILNEIKILSNTEQLQEISNNVYETLYASDNAIINVVKLLQRDIEKISDIDNNLKNVLEYFENIIVNLEELGVFFLDYKEKINFDPDRLQQLEKRLTDIENICFKYKMKLNELIDYKDNIESELQELESSNQSLEEYQKHLKAKEVFLLELSNKLSEKRRIFEKSFSKEIENKLNNLGMERARFYVKFDMPDRYIKFLFNDGIISNTGQETAIFMIKTNPGTDFMPLAKIASGGELSRVMLALKSVMVNVSSIDTLIFDEIDTGISGRIASIVGKEMKEISRYKQIICITHLHQIASFADFHYKVEKKIDNNITTTTIYQLDEKQRVGEIASMMGGDKNNKDFLATAERLIKDAQ